MGWGARQYLRMTPETTYGEYDGNNPALWIRMDRDNWFGMRAKPAQGLIRSADAGNRRLQAWKNMEVYGGGLATPLYPSQAGFLVGWLLRMITNAYGDPDLASVTIDHFDTRFARRYLGTKPAKGTITAAQATDNGKASLALELVAQRKDVPDSSFLEPTIANFPAENPYLFGHTSGKLNLGGARTKYRAFELTINNQLDGTVDELPYISDLVYCGRDIGWTFDTRYLSKADRDNYEATALQGASVAFEKGGSDYLRLDLKNANLITAVDDELAMNKAAYQKLSLATLLDGLAGADVSGSAMFTGGSLVTF